MDITADDLIKYVKEERKQHSGTVEGRVFFENWLFIVKAQFMMSIKDGLNEKERLDWFKAIGAL
jgi:hypothetical protein